MAVRRHEFSDKKIKLEKACVIWEKIFKLVRGFYKRHFLETQNY